MTDKALADEIYLEPLTVESHQAHHSSRNGPTACWPPSADRRGLTIGCQLGKVRLSGQSRRQTHRHESGRDRPRRGQGIVQRDHGEDRHQPCVPSDIAYTVEECRCGRGTARLSRHRASRVIRWAARAAAWPTTRRNFAVFRHNGLMLSPITQVLVEEYIYGWKEIEFEVLRDGARQRAHRLFDGKFRSRGHPYGRFHRHRACGHAFG